MPVLTVGRRYDDCTAKCVLLTKRTCQKLSGHHFPIFALIAFSSFPQPMLASFSCRLLGEILLYFWKGGLLPFGPMSASVQRRSYWTTVQLDFQTRKIDRKRQSRRNSAREPTMRAILVAAIAVATFSTTMTVKTTDANAVVCAKGVYRAGCVAPARAAAVRPAAACRYVIVNGVRVRRCV